MALFVAKKNSELVGPCIATETVYWFSCKRCPIEDCPSFTNCNPWSMFGEDNVKCYVKHHLMKSSSPEHELNEENAQVMVSFLDVEVDEWMIEERRKWAEENGTEPKPYCGSRKRKRGDGSSGNVGGVEPARGVAELRGEFAELKHNLQQHIKSLGSVVAGAVASSSSSPGPSSMLPIGGVPIGIGPSSSAWRHPSAGSSSVLGMGPSSAPMLRVLSENELGSRQAMLDRLVRMENSIRSAISHCVINARNLHSELEVIENIRRNV